MTSIKTYILIFIQDNAAVYKIAAILLHPGVLAVNPSSKDNVKKI